MQTKLIRRLIIGAIGVAALAFLVYAFLPSPVPVDMGEVTRGTLRVSVEEEAKTRVHDVYVVSAPVSGRLLRIQDEAGDPVAAGDSVVARLLPTDPSFLDVRSQTQAKAEVESAEAALALAQSEVERAAADAEFAYTEYQRVRELVNKQTLSRAALDRAERDWRATQATLDTANATVRVRRAQLENARARLIDPADLKASGGKAGVLGVRSPVSGRILRVLQESESVVAAGTPLLEVGDPHGDLEVVAELLSIDAVRVSPGNPVLIDKWGGPQPLNGTVERVEPFGRTKISALGVEEQRVNVIIRLKDQPEARAMLGHGFRVEVRIIVWQGDDLVLVPSSALFRHGEGWAVFAVENGTARLKPVRIGQDNGAHAWVEEGLKEGARVVLYPANRVADGVAVAQR